MTPSYTFRRLHAAVVALKRGTQTLAASNTLANCTHSQPARALNREQPTGTIMSAYGSVLHEVKARNRTSLKVDVSGRAPCTRPCTRPVPVHLQTASRWRLGGPAQEKSMAAERRGSGGVLSRVLSTSVRLYCNKRLRCRL